MNASRQITVSYSVLASSPTAPDAQWDRLSPEVHRQLPLRNLHWKSSSRSIRTIQALDVRFKPLSAFENGGGLLERPYLHLLFVVCEDNEVYRATIRSQIREWLDGVISKHKQEWLIVHVSSGRSGSASGAAKFYQRKGSIVDKIRADFNTGKNDRCVQVAQFFSAEDPTTWAEFQTRMKEGVIATFSANVALYEEDVRKADSQRQLDGWQYTTFFLQKEALADCFEAMNLIEDALIQYDELEASFFQTLKENNLSAPSSIGGTTPGDDALPLLSTANKDYRKLLLANTISVFDFRTYLFARQAAMLLILGRISEVAKRGAYFISTFTRTLREHQDVLGRNFVESWTYSACLNIVDECSKRANQGQLDSTVLESFTAVKAELLELARKQLDKIGIGAGHLPLIHPFSMSLNEVSPTSGSLSPVIPSAASTRDAISRPDLREAARNQEAFDKLYIDLTNRSISAYGSAGRKRCGLKLHATLAALEEKRTSSAQKLYSHLPAHYVDMRWVKIEASLLAQCTRLQKALEMNRERLLSTLALVRSGVEYGSRSWSLGADGEHGEEFEAERRAEEAKRLMDDVYDLSGTLSKDFAAIAFPTFSMRLASARGATAIGEDGLTVQLIIRSLLPCLLAIDEVRLKFSSGDGEQIWFTSAGCQLAQGETEITLFCPTAVVGRLALELSQIRYSRIIFQYSHRPLAPQNLAPDLRMAPVTATQPTISFPRDPQALNVYTEIPQAIDLDEPRQAILCITTGRNDLVKISLKVSSSHPDISLDATSAKVISASRMMVSAGDQLLHLEDLPASSTIRIQMPILGNLVEPFVDLFVSVEYYTAKRPTTRRTLRRTIEYSIALPVAVNVQDYFRADCLLSKFAVTTEGTNVLRLKSALLLGPDDVVIKASRRPEAPPITLLPLQTSNYLFKILRPPTQGQRTLRLSIIYCSVHEEFLARVRGVVQACLSSASTRLRDEDAWFTANVVADAEASTDMYTYGVTGHLDMLVFDEERWTPALQSKFADDARQTEALSELRGIYTRLREDECPEMVGSWRTLTIPVDLPSLNVLNLVRFTPSFNRTEVGQVLSVKLSIRPTFSWAKGAVPKRIPLTYDVTTSLDDWLISGRKRGEFEGEEGEETEVLLILVPLRPGSLFLPSVAIRPSTTAEGIWTCETQHLNASATVEVLPITARTTFQIDLATVQPPYIGVK